MDAIVELIAGPDRLGARLRGRGRRLLPRRELRRLREALEPPARGDAAGRGRRRRRAEGEPAGLRALEGAEGGRGHRLGRAVGPRPARAGTSSARRWPRRSSALDFEIHGGGSDLVFPHHENEIAQTEAARGKPLARIWMHNGMVRLEGEKMAKSVGNIFLLHEALEQAGRDALVMYFVSGPLPPADRLLAGRARRRRRASVERVRDFARRLDPDAPADGHRAVRGALLRRAGRRLQHARRARRAVRLDRRGQPAARRRRAPGSGRARRRCCGCSGSTTCSTRPRRAPTPRPSGCSSEREAARAARDFAHRRRQARRAGGARLDRAGHARGPEAGPLRLIVYGRNPVREAERRPQARAAEVGGAPGRRARADLRLAGPPGRLRRGRAVRATPTRTRCSPPTTRS